MKCKISSLVLNRAEFDEFKYSNFRNESFECCHILLYDICVVYSICNKNKKGNYFIRIRNTPNTIITIKC